MEKRKVLIIINPVAGKGKTINQLPVIKEILSDVDSLEVTYVVSKYRGNITETIADYFQKGYREFVGVGGDGTLSEIVNGLDYSCEDQIIVGIIPSGTGNDFVRNFKREYTTKAILDRLINKEAEAIDVGCVNSFYFINVCSFGIDGPIVEDTEKLKGFIPGPPAYLLSTLKSGILFKPNKVKLIIDEREISGEFLLVAIGNGKFIGGGMNICPDARINDGAFQICTVDNVSKFVFAKEISKIYKGKLKDVKAVNYYNGKEIYIEDKMRSYHINADGNLIGKTPAKISILKSALNFL